MALTRVQATPQVTTVASATTIAVTFSSPPTVGHGVIVAILNNATTPLTSVVDNKGNTYSLVVSHAEPSLPDLATIYFCPAITSTGTSFTITATGPNANRFAIAFEASGSIAVDQTTASNGAFPTAPTTGTTAAVTGSDVLMFALMGTSSTIITVDAATPTWTQEAEEVVNYPYGEVDSRSVTSAAGTTHSASWTLSGANYWTAVLAVFKSQTLIRVQATPSPYASSGTTITRTFSTTPTFGNGIIVGVLSLTRMTTGVTDNKGNTYTLATSASSGASAHNLAVYYCPAITATGVSFAVSAAFASSTFGLVVAVEVSGVGTGLTIDQSITNTASSATPSTGTTAALTIAEAFLFALFGGSIAQSSITVQSVSPSWTEDAENLTGTTAVSGEVDDRIVTGATGTTQSCSWTITTSETYIAGLVAFKATITDIRVTQDVIELISLPTPNARITQDTIELISLPTTINAQITQYVVEILSSTTVTALPEKSYIFIDDLFVR